MATKCWAQPSAWVMQTSKEKTTESASAVGLGHDLLGRAFGDLLAAPRGVTAQVVTARLALVPVPHGVAQLQIALSSCMHEDQHGRAAWKSSMEEPVPGWLGISDSDYLMNFYSV